MKIKLVKEDSKGKTYGDDFLRIFYRNKGSISGDNAENREELIYLVTGSTKITLKDSAKTVEAPARIEFPAKTYHKIEALTDICFVLQEK